MTARTKTMSHHDSSLDSEDTNLVEMWVRKDPVRWISGAMAGLFAGIVMMAFAMLLASLFGKDAWFPIKVAALPILGGQATEYGMNMRAILAGLVLHEAICMILGVLYAHFVFTQSLPALLGAGLVWGAFSWIFVFCLFIQSFKDVFAAAISPAAAFPVNMVFGLALSSVAFFDRTLRGKRS